MRSASSPRRHAHGPLNAVELIELGKLVLAHKASDQGAGAFRPGVATVAIRGLDVPPRFLQPLDLLAADAFAGRGALQDFVVRLRLDAARSEGA